MSNTSLKVHKHHNNFIDIKDKDVCIFVSFAPYGKIRPGALAYYQEIIKNNILPIVCLIANDLDTLKYDARLEGAFAIVHRGNDGWDFSAWADVLRHIPQLWGAKRLYFANDSVFCLPTLFSQTIEKIRSSSADYIAMTDSFEIQHHTQSYFFVLQNKSLTNEDMLSFWSDLRPLKDKKDVIKFYETTFLSIAKKSNLSVNILFPLDNFFHKSEFNNIKYINPTFHLWETLINNGFPFIKVALIVENPYHQPISHWKYIADQCKADTSAYEISRKMIEAYNYRKINKKISKSMQKFKDENRRDPKKILVHVHLFYPDLWSEIKIHLININVHFDLFVTMIEDHIDIYHDISTFKPDAKIITIQNKGYDIGAFLHVLRQVDMGEYSYVIKLHTKRDMPEKAILSTGVAVGGSLWREHSLAFLKTPEIFQRCLDAFQNDPMIGMCARYDLILSKSSDDKSAGNYGDAILTRMGLPRKKLAFVAGTMFMVRARLLEALLLLDLDIDDFSTPIRGEKTSLAHNIERILGWMVGAQGYAVRDCFTPTKQRIREKIVRFLFTTSRFLYRVKTTKNGNRIIKICKIPFHIK